MVSQDQWEPRMRELGKIQEQMEGQIKRLCEASQHFDQEVQNLGNDRSK